MAKDRKKVQHIHSSVFDKQPTPQSLELGELAVNANKNGSFISTKNSNNEVVRFSEDATIVDWMEYKEVFPYSATVTTPTEQDLKDNKSQLLFKINQVVPTKTPYGTDVNGAMDMHGDEINPLSPDGTKDGAGFAVNMDMYAMNGGNPSFSSITTTCGALLQGTTKIQGLDGSCGSLLDINVGTAKTVADSAYTNVQTATTTVSSANTTIGTATTTVTSATTNVTNHTYSGENLTIKTTDTTSISGANFDVKATTTSISGGTIGTYTTGNTQINANGNVNVISTGATNITSTNNNVCITAEKDADFYGKVNTKVGVSCGGDVTPNLGLSGTTINESGNTINITSAGDTIINASDEIIMSAVTDVKVDTDVLCLNGATKAALYGATTNIGVNCNSGASATTINISGTTINEGGTNLTQNFTNGTVNITNYDVNGDVICISGATNANIYGAETNIGIDCNNTTTATTINISGTTINLGGDEVTINVLDDLCLNSREDITLYGSQSTNVGISCDGTATAAMTTVRGNKVIVDAVVGNLGLTAKEDILESAENGIVITANNDLCSTAGVDATFYGVSKTNIGTDCESANVSTTTTINGETIAESGGTVNVSSTGATCVAAGTNANFYGATTNIGKSCDNNTSTTTNIEGTTINENGGNVNITSTASTTINANTTLCMEGNTKAALYGKETHIGLNCSSGKTSSSVTINSTTSVTINSPVTNITGDTHISGDTIIKGDTYISGDTIVGGSVTVANGLGAKVCSEYGDVRSATGKCSNLSGSSTTTFTIPNEFSHMKNHKNSDGSHTSDYYTFEYPIEINGTVTAVAAIYSSDERLKENIKPVTRNDFNKAKRVQAKSFNFKDDPNKTKTYGVIAQEVEAAGLNELVYTKEDGFKAVDYTAFMILKLSYLEDFCVNLSMQNEELRKRIIELENKK